MLKVILQSLLKQGLQDGERLNLRIGRTGASLRAALSGDDTRTDGRPRAYRRCLWRFSARRRGTRPRSDEPVPDAADRVAAALLGEWPAPQAPAAERPAALDRAAVAQAAAAQAADRAAPARAAAVRAAADQPATEEDQAPEEGGVGNSGCRILC
jgi:hypothetical protein